MIKTITNNFNDIYKFYKQISGNHNGIINRKIYQCVSSDDDVDFCAMTADFPNYSRLLNYNNSVAYHLSGYGRNREEALIRLIGESIERYSVVYAYEMFKNQIIYSSYHDLIQKGVKVVDLKYLNVYDHNKNKLIHNINSDEVIGWFKTIDLISQEDLYIPAQLYLLSYLNDANFIKEPRAYFAVSTGTATHTSYKKALENALVEYLQIDSFMLSWYIKSIKVPKVIISNKFKEFIKRNHLVSDDFEILVLDFTLDKPFPIFGVFLIGKRYPFISFGVQGGGDPYHTLYRGILEAATILQYNYTSFVYNKEKFDLGHKKENAYLDLDSNVIFWASENKKEEKLNFLKNMINGSINLDDIKSNNNVLSSSIKYCKDNNFDVACYDITCSELGLSEWCTIRAVIPQLLPMCLPGIPFSNHPRMIEFGGFNYELPHPLP